MITVLLTFSKKTMYYKKIANINEKLQMKSFKI